MDTRTPSRRTQSRFRLPGIENVGFAQLSLVETALYPLDRGLNDIRSFSTRYKFTDGGGERREAIVKVGCALEPLKANDDYFLWSLLSLTLRYSETNVLTATPYWLLTQMGLSTGGFDYEHLRRVVERLAQTVYHNTGFYNPLTQDHERWTFAFFSSRLPTSLDSDRLWRIAWFDDFIKVSRTTGGRLLFDLELFRKLGSPATRRLFLKLSDRFYRSNRVYFDIDDLTVNGLGLSASRPLYKRKFDLAQCMETLREHGIISLGKGHRSVKDLFLKRAKGRYVVSFLKGPYFEHPLSDTPHKNATDDPLYEPMKILGIDEAMIRSLLRSCQRGKLERWLRITEAALHDKPQGFPGFKRSPAAFFVDGVLNDRTPPDWMYQLDKDRQQREHDAAMAKQETAQAILRIEYDSQRQTALEAFLKTDQGRELYKQAHDARFALNRAYGSPDPDAKRRADVEAKKWIDQNEDFTFPEYSVWALARQTDAE